MHSMPILSAARPAGDCSPRWPAAAREARRRPPAQAIGAEESEAKGGASSALERVRDTHICARRERDGLRCYGRRCGRGCRRSWGRSETVVRRTRGANVARDRSDATAAWRRHPRLQLAHRPAPRHPALSARGHRRHRYPTALRLARRSRRHYTAARCPHTQRPNGWRSSSTTSIPRSSPPPCASRPPCACWTPWASRWRG